MTDVGLILPRYEGAYDGPVGAHDYAQSLLSDLNVAGATLPDAPREHPVFAWARSGAMALTGFRGEPPRVCPVPVASCADGALMALASLGARSLPADLSGARLLGERAAIAGFSRNGSTSIGGTCRLLEASDGWIAINLARDDDWDMLPALVEQNIKLRWPALATAAREMETDILVARGREIGLPIARHGSVHVVDRWFEIVKNGGSGRFSGRQSPIVVDLSSLWAGPLCSHLLRLMGARVVKVESLKRPDGARLGPSQFYDLMNGGKESVALDFSTVQGREALLSLIAKADIVIESSRPRALRQLGIFAETLIEKHPGLIWLSITGYGRRGDEANWVAFGDDAGVAAGLNSLISRRGARPIFCGDAIGDPLTGLHGALLAWSRWQSRRGGLLAITLRDVVARCATFDRQSPIANAAEREIEWEGLLSARRISAAPPTARRPENAARPLGADNAKVLRELEVFC